MNAAIISSNRLSPLEVLQDVAFVALVDASGSMEHVEAETRDSANAFVATLQEGTPITFSLAVFASAVRWVNIEQPVDTVRPLTRREYQAGGLTVLYDAIGEGIERVEAMDIPPVHPVIAVFTDGSDMYSARYDAATLTPMVAERRARGWRFIAFVVGDEAQAAMEQAGFLAADIVQYAGDGASTAAAFKALAASTQRLVAAVENKALPPARFV